MNKKQLINMLEGSIDLSKVMANGGELTTTCKKPGATTVEDPGVSSISIKDPVFIDQPIANFGEADSCTNNGAAFDYYKSM